MFRNISFVLFSKKNQFRVLNFVQVENLTYSLNTCIDKRQMDLMSKNLPRRKCIEGVNKIIMIASGKGGVGKSMIATNLAVALKKLDSTKEVGLLDADVFGPTIPLMMNLHDSPLLTDDNYMKPLINYGVKCMSMGNLITEKSAAIWRGLMVMNAIEKLLRQVAWAPLDYLIIDTPPGTGDTHLSLVQNIPIDGTVLVTTSSRVSLQVVRRGITMFQKLQIPVIGIINNMSNVICSRCSNQISVFPSNIEKFSKDENISILANIPLDSKISECCDNGTPISVTSIDSFQAKEFLKAAEKITGFLQLKQ